MRLASELLERIDDWRRSQPDRPSREAAIQRLIELALQDGAEPPLRHAVGPEDEARSGPEAIERPKRQLDD